MIYRVIIILVIAFVFLPSGCLDDGPSASARSAEEVRIEREVKQRVEVAEKENGLKARQDQLHTIRVTGFIILTAGAVTALMWRQRPLSPVNPVLGAGIHSPQPVQWNNPGNQPPRSSIWTKRRVARTGRVIDMTGLKPSDASPDPVTPQVFPSPDPRQNRDPNHRNHNHNPPPSP